MLLEQFYPGDLLTVAHGGAAMFVKFGLFAPSPASVMYEHHIALVLHVESIPVNTLDPNDQSIRFVKALVTSLIDKNYAQINWIAIHQLKRINDK